MPTVAASLDAQIFAAIHEALALCESVGGENRREGERRAFRCVQLVAPYDGRTLPGPVDYTHVMCHDLSPGGFSFQSPQPAAQRRYLVALGRTPFQFFECKVVNERPYEVAGQPQWLIGCQFVNRL